MNDNYEKVHSATKRLASAQYEYDHASQVYFAWSHDFALMTRNTYRADHIHFSFSIGPNGAFNKEDARSLRITELLGEDWQARIQRLVDEREQLLIKAGENLLKASKEHAEALSAVFGA